MIGERRRFPMKFSLCSTAALLILIAGLFSACTSSEPDVVIYCALDQNFSEQLIKKFEKESGLKVKGNYDKEAHKTVGLVRKIIEEKNNPRCDIFWNNEIANTIRLKKMDLLQPYVSKNAADIPDTFKDAEGYWTGLAARARVFIINTEMMPDKDKWPKSYKDLIDPAFKGKGGIAKPLTGTTATHGSVFYQLLGDEKATDYFKEICKTDVHLASGNAHIMRLVRDGKLAFGFTDTDDYNVAKIQKFPVEAIYPDQGEGEFGTLVIPNTVAMIKNCPHPEAAKKLIDFILSHEVEEALAFGDSAQIPLHPGVKKPAHVKVPGKDFKAMKVDFEKAAKDFDRSQKIFGKLFVK